MAQRASGPRRIVVAGGVPQAPVPESNPFGKDHIPNLPEYLARRRIAERSIVNKPFTQTGWPRPSCHGRGLVLVSHVDMKMPIAADLEKYDLTVVRKRSLCRESSDPLSPAPQHPPSMSRSEVCAWS